MTHIIIDIEATCDNNKEFLMETIEIGAIKVDDENEIIDTFEILIKPHNSFINEYCTNLTGIRPKDTENADTFDIAISKFKDFLGEDYIIYSWGGFDKRQLIKDSLVHNIDDSFLDNHANIKDMYTKVTGIRAKGLMRAVRNLKIEFEGNHHRALPDALATAKIFIELRKIEDGFVYCLDCVRGRILIDAMIKDIKIPNKCIECNPNNPEDSMRLRERPMYKKK